MTFALLSILMPLLLGFMLVILIWPGQARENYLVRGVTSLGIGLGVSSILLFAWLLVSRGGHAGYPLFEKVLLAVLIIFLFYIIKKGKLSFGGLRHVSPTGTNYIRVLKAAFYVLLASSLLVFIFLYLNNPHGQWDAWAIWNIHARFIFRGEEHWLNLFSNLIGWSHPDYPLLVPMLVANGWINTGYETTAVPAITAFIFVFSSILLIWSSLSVLRTPSQGILAGLVLAGTAFFIRQGAWQYADVPLAFYFLLTLVLFAFFDAREDHRALILAGMAAGLSAWTKNEGFLFLVSVIAARAFIIIPKKGLRSFSRQVLNFSAGLAPVLIPVIYFKLKLTPPNDLVSAQGAETLAKLADISRYFQILKAYAITAIKFTEGPVGPPLLIVYLFLAGLNGQRDRVSTNTLLVTLVLMLAGYFLVFVATPSDLAWHMATSLNRLFLQLWPGFVFYFFLMVNTPEEMLRKRDGK